MPVFSQPKALAQSAALDGFMIAACARRRTCFLSLKCKGGGFSSKRFDLRPGRGLQSLRLGPSENPAIGQMEISKDDEADQQIGNLRFFSPAIRIIGVMVVVIMRIKNMAPLQPQTPVRQAALQMRRNIGPIGDNRHGNTMDEGRLDSTRSGAVCSTQPLTSVGQDCGAQGTRPPAGEPLRQNQGPMPLQCLYNAAIRTAA